MAHVHLERRKDGLIHLRPSEPRFTRAEWYLAAFTTFMIAAGMFIAAVVPPLLLAMLLMAVLVGELCFALRDLLDLRRPRADVLAFARVRQ
jgi:hypothetical protein